jgi:hypothetical protein
MQLLEEDRIKIKKAVQEASDSMYRAEAEKSLQKEIIENVFDQYKIPKKTISKMIRVYHKQNFPEEVAAADEFETLYQTVTGVVEVQ